MNAIGRSPVSGGPARRRGTLLWILFAAVIVVMRVGLASASCSAPRNAIEAENCLPGSDPSEWTIDGTGDASIQGFTTDISVNVGQTVQFKINTTASAYSIEIYRLGYYGLGSSNPGQGARLVKTIAPSASLPQRQPPCATDSTTSLYDCGTWAVSASWAVPTTAVSGVYLAILYRPDTGGASQIPFIVRNDASHSDIVFRTSDESWQAYNPFGGHSLYGPAVFDLNDRAYKVSYNRPWGTLSLEDETFLFYAEAPMIRWLEANGYDVTYTASVDAARNGALIKNHKLLLSVGHDEYVSGPERTSIEAARDAGTNLAFFSGNEFFWKTRWENSIDGSGTPYRTLVCYKETVGPTSSPSGTKAVDPQDPPTWTGTWRDPTHSPPSDGGRPENALTGQLFRVNGPGTDNTNLSIKVPAAQGKMRFWRNTQIAAQSPGQVWTLPAGTLGYEWDAEEDNGARPAGLFDLSTATYTLTTDYLQDYGGFYGAGTATHHMSLYRAKSKALVFGAGTVQWTWGLDSNHTGGGGAADINMQQATVNLFADMGVQPVTLQAGLVAATASTDLAPPSSTITAPSPGVTAHVGTAVTVSGTAADAGGGGGLVAGVEVSVDGGATWHPAVGTSSWTYSWTPATTGSTTIQSRAVDDSGNLETPTSTVTVSVLGAICPCSLFGSQQPLTGNASDGVSYELGMKFQVDRPGQITAIRFDKAPSETGTHTGRLWTGDGTLLGSVNFASETASGWQQQALASPITIQANTTYVVSVNANLYYVSTNSGLASPIVNGDLSSVADGANGVYGTKGSFPASSYQNTDYFRDTQFTPTAAAGVVKVSGDGQTGLPGKVLPSPLVVKVLDANGLAVSGNTVSFTVTSGGATVSPTSAVTNSSGQASTTVTLGSTAEVEAIHAAVTGIGSIDFTETVQQQAVFTGQTPASPNSTEGTAYELGMKFQSSAPGQITAIRFWKSSSETGSHTGTIWSATGTPLATANFTSETGSGWQLQPLATPLVIQANTTYVVSVNANVYYAATTNGLATSVTNGPLSSVADGANGVYAKPGVFPTSSYQSTNYFRDASFSQSSIVLKSSGDNQAGAPNTLLANPLVVSVFDASGHALAGTTVTFSVTAGGASVTPTSAVTDANGLASTKLTLGSAIGKDTVHAAAAGVGSVDFNATAQPYTVFTSQVPSVLNNNDGVGYELGMKFQSSQAGQIAAIRFYKAPSETGTHTGHIWSATGTLLATVPFSGETASGWQIQSLPTPLTIQPGTTYVVSVNTNGYYSATNSGLATAVVNGPVSSVADGANGLFGGPGAFPTSSWQNTNYFRDIGFVLQ